MNYILVTASGPTKRRQACILINTGSQKTFIMQCLKNTRQLKAARSEILDVTTFGLTRGTPKSYEVVTLTINAEKSKITALVTPIICLHYPASTFQTNQHLESTSTFQNYISNHSTETHSNGLRFGIVIVMQYTAIMN